MKKDNNFMLWAQGIFTSLLLLQVYATVFWGAHWAFFAFLAILYVDFSVTRFYWQTWNDRMELKRMELEAWRALNRAAQTFQPPSNFPVPGVYF